MANTILGFDLSCEGLIDVKEFMGLSEAIYKHIQVGDLCPGYEFIRFSGSPNKNSQASVYAYYSICDRYYDKENRKFITKSIKQTPKITFYNLSVMSKFKFYIKTKEFEYLYDCFNRLHNRGIKKLPFIIKNRHFIINDLIELFIYDFLK
jgi:hypothetical protein